MGEKESRSCDAYFLFFLLHIMLNVAVFLEIKFSVVLLMFLLLIFILMLSGVLALLYHLHCTHYTLRGGTSNSDTFCGALCISTLINVGVTYWNVGAALSRVHIILFVVVFLTVMHFGAYSLLVLTILLLLLAGVMELL